MKAFLLLLFALAGILAVDAQTPKWTFEPSHCKVGFSISHFGISETEGQFKKFTGSITADKDDFSDARIEFNVDVNSINTDDEQRDGHLKSADFFDAAKYPAMTFKSKSMKPMGKNKYKLMGDLTMHGITKEVELDVLFGGILNKDPFGNTKAGFKVTGNINRKDWGLMWNKVLDTGGLAVGEQVAIACNIELLKAK